MELLFALVEYNHILSRIAVVVGAAMPVVDFSHDIDNSNMNLTVDSITSTGSRLTWQRPAELRNINGFTLYIQETLMERESYRELKLIHPEVQEYFVHDLSPATQYTATLKALEEGNRVVASQSLQLQTLDISGMYEKKEVSNNDSYGLVSQEHLSSQVCTGTEQYGDFAVAVRKSKGRNRVMLDQIEANVKVGSNLKKQETSTSLQRNFKK